MIKIAEYGGRDIGDFWEIGGCGELAIFDEKFYLWI